MSADIFGRFAGFFDCHFEEKLNSVDENSMSVRQKSDRIDQKCMFSASDRCFDNVIYTSPKLKICPRLRQGQDPFSMPSHAR